MPLLIIRYSVGDWMRAKLDGIKFGMELLQGIVGGFAGNRGECWAWEGGIW